MCNFRKQIYLLLIAGSFAISQTPGYFKDVFVDGGVHLTSMIAFPAAEDLELEIEYLGTDAESAQTASMIGNNVDSNGHLLYPDGEPRFQMIYMNGGSSTNHGASLGELGRERVRQYYRNGGSFMGSCAGAFITSLHYQSSLTWRFYYHIWPGRTKSTGLLDSLTHHDIPPDSPLLEYFDFGNDLMIAGVRHNGGGWAREDIDFPPETEALLRYQVPERPDMHGKLSTWAYKPDDRHGRIVVIGSHPEFEQTGEIFDLTQAMVLYALDGVGSTHVKAELIDGESRTMDLFSEDSLPEFTRIGDKQYHHYTVTVPPEANRIIVELDAEESYDFNLYANPDDFAFEDKALITSVDDGAHHWMEISASASDLWYIGVECATTIKSVNHIYWGQTDVLNGVAYTITASYDTVTVVGVADNSISPSASELKPAYPNPFNPTTTIGYRLAEYSTVDITVFDATGRPIKRLVETQQEAGNYNTRWNGTDDQGLGVPAGLYFARLDAGGFSQTIKMLYLK